MRLLFDGPDGTREVCVTGGTVTSVGELAEALGIPPPASGLWVQDRWAAAGCRLDEAGVVDGTRVGVRAGPSPDQPGWTLEVIGGLRAGDRHRLGDDGLVVGRSPDADLSVQDAGLRPRHVRFLLQNLNGHELDGHELNGQGQASDSGRGYELGSKAGRVMVQFDRGDPEPLEALEPLRVGSTLIQATLSPDDRPHRQAAVLGYTSTGKIAFNRPPRPAPPEPPQPLPAPAHEPARASRSISFGWAALAGPLLIGILMAVLYRPYMALFALLSPLMMGANWIDNRRRDRSDRRRSRRRNRDALADFREAAVAAHAAETHRRRARYPPLAEAVRRVRQPSMKLWERKPGHDDFMTLVVGHGSVPFTPQFAVGGSNPAPEVAEVLDRLGPLVNAPIPVNLGPGELLGLVGPREATTAIARGLLLQVAAFHGPADVAVLVAVDDTTAPGWMWASWLPHTAHPALGGHRPMIAPRRDAAAELVADLTEVRQRHHGGTWPQLLAVVDGENLVTGRQPPVRPLLLGAAGPVSAIVLAANVDELPAAATTVIEASDRSGTVKLTTSGSNETIASVLASGMSVELARTTARCLARFEDPDLSGADTGIPDHTSLFGLLNLPGPDDGPDGLAAAVTARWDKSEAADSLVAVIGADGHGPLTIDMVADGPHALVGGTTGSGKSELLRTMVASVAATCSPTQANFVLVDYKGGSAFDACSSLPHVVGLVTDLEDRLAERALRCLEAELRHREQILRDRGAGDLAHYRLLAPLGAPPASGEPSWPPLPRLVIIIDEFAALAKELPAFMDSLVNVAQRGRSLGMHLVLATQRPAGAVNANIRTNAALRIALRMLDTADSIDILDSPEAAAIGRDQPGRAFARLGPGELVGFQAALVTGSTSNHQGLRVVPAIDGVPETAPEPASCDDTATDLLRLVEATAVAWSRRQASPPRRPWPDPLPEIVPLESLASHSSEPGSSAAFALADNPDRQCQYPLSWDPNQGNVLFTGIPGSGPATALMALAVALAGARSPVGLHLYAVEYGSGGLAPLDGLPHCGAVIGFGEQDRLRRLIHRLEQELDRRLSHHRQPHDTGQSPPPMVITLFDNWTGLVKSLDTVTDHGLLSSLERVWAEGPAVGLYMAAAADQLSQVSRAIQAATPQTFVFRLGDPMQYHQWGIAVGDPATLPPGRGFAIGSGLEFQVAVHDGGAAAAVATIARAHPATGGPPPVETLPPRVDASSLDSAELCRTPIYLPLGLSDSTLAPVGLTLYPGEHALILGPARSGRSTALALVAWVAARAGGRVVALVPEGSPQTAGCDVEIVARNPGELLHAAETADRPVLVLIDDVETVDDPDGSLKALPAGSGSGLHIVAAGRADRLRTAYGHWTAEIRFSRTGVLLQPSPLDGDLFSLQLPTRPALPAIAGRGWLVQNGQPTIIQMATC